MSMGMTSVKPTQLMGFWNYNRTNYEFDVGMRSKRFSAGRAMACKQVGMFRDDVADLTMVPVKKMMIYTPIATVCCGYCVTVFIEGRSGLKFPAPPTFISGVYLQCLGIGFVFMGLAAWLVFHAGMRACVAAVQMRTRTVRLPLPTQRQLDQARKLGSSYEETSFYDMLRVPYVMPNLADTPDNSADEDPDFAGDIGGEPSAKKKDGKGKSFSKDKGKKMPQPQPIGKKTRKSTRMPYRAGCPEWIERENEFYDENPNDAPSTYGNGPAVEPYEHFEMIRKAQRDWWGAEVYGRICILTGQIHLVQGFGYWLTIHCVAELGMYWGAQLCAGTFTAAIWLLFHMDVLPEKGGFYPVEAGGPFLSALTLLLQYSHNPTTFTLNLSRVLGVVVIILNIVFTLRLLMIAHPGNQHPGSAREVAGQKNLSGSCEHPSWLPTAYQHVQYLVAPPPAPKDANSKDGYKEEDPMINVDMMPWRATRGLYIACVVSWFILLLGRIVEAAQGERMLLTNPGMPPWTRIGQWDGWESGPITSKHYAHVTPMRGHFAWKWGQGPNGFVEIWPSDLYGFHPEADAHWADENNIDLNAPPGRAKHILESYPMAIIPKPPNWNHCSGPGCGPTMPGDHGEDDPGLGANWGEPGSGGHGGGHRRMQNSFLQADVVRPLVPAAVKWPSLLEPDFLACAPSSRGGQVAAFSATGHGALVSEEAASGKVPGAAIPFNFTGLPATGFTRGATWSHDGLTIVSGNGELHSCVHIADSYNFRCEPFAGPALPLPEVAAETLERSGPLPAVAVVTGKDGKHFAAVAAEAGEVRIMHLGFGWEVAAKVQLPFNSESPETERPSVVALSAAEDHLIVAASDGATYRWELRDGIPTSTPHREAPAAAGAYTAAGAASQRNWKSACLLPNGKIIRLTSRWQKSGAAGGLAWHPELLF